jgi:septum formation protein
VSEPRASAPLVLASTSPYRKALLAQLRVPFSIASPMFDESPLPGEAPDALAARLAEGKARAVAPKFPDALIIGCDQVAVVGDLRLDKPGGFATAALQLEAMSGRAVSFFTALSLLNARSGTLQSDVVPYTVHMRALTRAEIERYLRAEEPYDCAGSARIEGLGIALVSRLEGSDPNALIGLPLIALRRMLANEGLEVP